MQEGRRLISEIGSVYMTIKALFVLFLEPSFAILTFVKYCSGLAAKFVFQLVGFQARCMGISLLSVHCHGPGKL